MAPSFSDLWFSEPLPKSAKQEWATRTNYTDHVAPSALQLEKLAFAKRAGTSLEKLKALGLDRFVEPTAAQPEPPSSKGQDNFDDENNDLKAYVSQITAAAVQAAGFDSELGAAEDDEADETDAEKPPVV